jgi:phiKZ-like phage internal head proteins
VIEQIKIYALFVKLADKRLLNFNFGVLKMAKGLVFAMENDEVSQAATGDQAIAQSTAEVEEAASQVAAEAQEIAQLTEETDSAVADAGTLEKVQSAVAQTVQSGQGMDETTAQVAQVVVESICARLGIPGGHRLMPAVESFGSSNTRMAATKVALENAFTDTIKRIWEAIKKAIKTTWQKIKEFFLKFFDNTDKVRKHADALNAKAKERMSWKMDKTTLELPGIIKTLGGNVEGAAKGHLLAVGNHMALTQLGDGFIQTCQGIVKTAEQLTASLNGDPNSNIAKGNVSKLVDGVEKLAASYESAKMGSLPSKTETQGDKTITKHYYGPFIDSNCICIAETVDNKSGHNSIKYSFEPMKVSNDAKELPTMPMSAVATICAGVKEMMNATDGFKKNSRNIENVGSGLLSAADGVLKAADSLSGGNEHVTELRAIITDLSSWFAKYVTLTPSINVRLANACLKYVSASINAHKEN